MSSKSVEGFSMVSVIIPIYNVEEFLPRCLDSVCGQTFSDLEIILVDDGSTDSSGQICDTYARSDSRIRVIHKENGGLSEARNTGLDKATGEYILMPDGDDVLHPQMIEILYNLITSGNYEFSMCMGDEVYDTSKILMKAVETYTDIPSTVYRQEELLKIWGLEYFQNQGHYSVAWNKLFKRSSLDGLRYIKTMEEDVEFSCRYYQRIQKAIVTSLLLYYYIQRIGSLTNPTTGFRYVHIPETTMECLKDLPEESSEYRALVLRRLYRQMPFLLRKAVVCPSVYRETKKQYKVFIKSTIREFISNPHIPFWMKVELGAFNYSPFLCRLYLYYTNVRAKWRIIRCRFV